VDPTDEILNRRVGSLVGSRWTIQRLIGTGGMAAVYAASDSAGHRAAIKMLLPEMGVRSDIRERFLREASVMQQLVHPGMVTIFEHGTEVDTAYLAMELLEGESLSSRVRRLGRLPVEEILIILDQLLDVLIVAHNQGVIHRDLKPDNLFLTREGRIKVLDFGLARILGEGKNRFQTRTGAALGTLPYMAPEQAQGRRHDVDARTDLFAAGATAFRLYSGRRIHEAPTDAELLMCMAAEAAPPLLSVVPEAPKGLAQVIDRALSFNKTDRYPDAAQMQSDVRDLLAGRMPHFAATSFQNDEVATRIERAIAVEAPRSVSTTTPDAQERAHLGPKSAEANVQSQRVIAPTVVMPASLRGETPPVLNGSAPTASMRSLEPLPSSAVSHRVPAEATVNDFQPYALQSETKGPYGEDGRMLAQLPWSPDAVAQKRKRTLLTGLFLFGVLLVVTTLIIYVLLSTSSPESRQSLGLLKIL
jgi:serine/threonine-protein kinase